MSVTKGLFQQCGEHNAEDSEIQHATLFYSVSYRKMLGVLIVTLHSGVHIVVQLLNHCD